MVKWNVVQKPLISNKQLIIDSCQSGSFVWELKAQHALIYFSQKFNFSRQLREAVFDRFREKATIANGATFKWPVQSSDFAIVVSIEWTRNKLSGGQLEEKSFCYLNVIVVKLNRWKDAFFLFSGYYYYLLQYCNQSFNFCLQLSTLRRFLFSRYLGTALTDWKN